MSSRVAPALLVAALLAATSAAFVVTEKLKLTRSPIIGPTVAKVFSPTCDCGTASADIRFRLRTPDRVSVEIIDSGGDVVRELARDRPQSRRFVTYVWDGRDDAGRVVDEGTYRPRIHLDRQRRTIVMPNRIRVDTTAPRVVSFTARPLVISPDGDGRSDIWSSAADAVGSVANYYRSFGWETGAPVEIEASASGEEVESVLVQAEEKFDRRWVRCRRPFITTGGELTMEMLDLMYIENAKIYDAPYQLKANNGMYLIDDFGRQQITPAELLNRWIYPLDRGRDYLMFNTGSKIEVPFECFLIFSSNLKPSPRPRGRISMITSPYWPWPPDCFLWRPRTCETGLRMDSR